MKSFLVQMLIVSADEFNYNDVPIVYCECAINVILRGAQRDLTFGKQAGLLLWHPLNTLLSACPYPYPDPENMKVYDPFTEQRNSNGTYTCGVRGGYCLDTTYYDPGPPQMYENDTTFCHTRDCAKMVKRFRGCVASDAFIQRVYINKKNSKSAVKRTPEEWAKTDHHFPKPTSICHGAYGSPPEFNGSYFIYNEWGQWGISHVPLEFGTKGGVRKHKVKSP